MKENKLKIIVISGICLAILALIVFFIVYFSTDFLKPSNKVFEKYFSKSITVIDEITNVSAEDEYINNLRTKDYKDNTNISLKYTNNQGNIEQFNSTISRNYK